MLSCCALHPMRPLSPVQTLQGRGRKVHCCRRCLQQHGNSATPRTAHVYSASAAGKDLTGPLDTSSEELSDLLTDLSPRSESQQHAAGFVVGAAHANEAASHDDAWLKGTSILHDIWPDYGKPDGWILPTVLQPVSPPKEEPKLTWDQVEQAAAQAATNTTLSGTGPHALVSRFTDVHTGGMPSESDQVTPLVMNEREGTKFTFLDYNRLISTINVGQKMEVEPVTLSTQQMMDDLHAYKQQLMRVRQQNNRRWNHQQQHQQQLPHTQHPANARFLLPHHHEYQQANVSSHYAAADDPTDSSAWPGMGSAVLQGASTSSGTTNEGSHSSSRQLADSDFHSTSSSSSSSSSNSSSSTPTYGSSPTPRLPLSPKPFRRAKFRLRLPVLPSISPLTDEPAHPDEDKQLYRRRVWMMHQEQKRRRRFFRQQQQEQEEQQEQTSTSAPGNTESTSTSTSDSAAQAPGPRPTRPYAGIRAVRAADWSYPEEAVSARERARWLLENSPELETDSAAAAEKLTLMNRLVMSHMASCRGDWVEVCTTVAEFGPYMDLGAVGYAMQTIGQSLNLGGIRYKLPPEQRARLANTLSRCVRLIHLKINSTQSEALGLLLLGIFRLGSRQLSTRLLPVLLQRLTVLLPQIQPQVLVVCLRALAGMRVHPAQRLPGVMYKLQWHLFKHMESLDSCQLVTAAWAMIKLHSMPSRPFVKEFRRRCVSGLPDLDPAALLRLLVVLDKTRWVVPLSRQVKEAVEGHVSGLLPRMAPSQLGCCAAMLAQMEHVPSPALQQQLMDAVQQRLASCACGDLSLVLGAVARWGQLSAARPVGGKRAAGASDGHSGKVELSPQWLLDVTRQFQAGLAAVSADDPQAMSSTAVSTSRFIHALSHLGVLPSSSMPAHQAVAAAQQAHPTAAQYQHQDDSGTHASSSSASSVEEEDGGVLLALRITCADIVGSCTSAMVHHMSMYYLMQLLEGMARLGLDPTVSFQASMEAAVIQCPEQMNDVMWQRLQESYQALNMKCSKELSRVMFIHA